MSLEKLEKLAKLVLDELSAVGTGKLSFSPHLDVRFKNLMVVAYKSLPDHQELLTLSHKKIEYVSEATSVIKHLLKILEIEKASKMKIKEMKIFESAEEKMEQANLSFGKEDYSSVFNNLNTALELILKDKCGIPTTITGINTSNVIELLVKYNVEPYAHFSEARKRVTDVANRVKHQGYVPTKKEAIFGIKAMEELVSKLRDKEIKLTEEIKDKIFQGL